MTCKIWTMKYTVFSGGFFELLSEMRKAGEESELRFLLEFGFFFLSLFSQIPPPDFLGIAQQSRAEHFNTV